MRKYKIAAALGALMAHGTLFAAALPDAPAPRGERGPMALFKMADANSDGSVTKAEFTAALDKHFTKLDANKDGKLTKEDWQILRQQRVDARFGEIDADKNGQISKGEFAASADKRHDGKAGARDGRRWGAGAGMGMGRGPGAGKDGDTSKADFMARPLALFDRIDSNHDGKISADEAKAAGALRGRDGMGGGGDRDGRGGMGRGHGMHGDAPPPPPAQK